MRDPLLADRKGTCSVAAGTLRSDSQIPSSFPLRFPSESWADLVRKQGTTYAATKRTRSDIYSEFLPLANSGLVELLDHDRTIKQLLALVLSQCAGAVAGALLLTLIIPATTQGNIGAHGLGVKVTVGGMLGVNHDWPSELWGVAAFTEDRQFKSVDEGGIN